jgi:hypothetical protein
MTADPKLHDFVAAHAHNGTTMPTPETAELHDSLLELALRIDELRQLCVTGATEINGRMWIPAEEVLKRI